MANKRPYNKTAPYWGQPRKQAMELAQATPIVQAPFVEADAAFDGKSHYSSFAACGGGDVNTISYRDNAAPTLLDLNRYPNIRAGIVPLNTIEGNYTTFGAVSLVYSAYFNFALLRNAISMLTDFSVGTIRVKTSNKRVKTFIETWFDSIGLNQFQAKWFLEYYRSGNVFIYKFSGKISEDGLNMLKKSFSSETFAPKEAFAARVSKTVPIRYIILNPMQVYLQRGASYAYGYVRMLSTYEIERLKNPQTTEDQQMFNSFPEDIQRQIKQGGSWRYLFVPLDQNRLYYNFYRKTDYEPLAVPMAFPLLNDIEFKLELRRIDMTLARTMEQVILLVTAGRQADQFNQNSSKAQLQSLQNIFQNQTIGRVLVADYTTKAEWVIPNLKELLGPEKYERVDKDIKEGLQYMFFGEEKFANASIKIKIFIESLKEGRREFLDNFLIPEVKKICEAMNFRDVPSLEFDEIVLQDEALMNRLYVQLGQLGMLTPNETFVAMKTGDLPDEEESLQHQEAYKEQKKKGLYALPVAPMAGGGAGGNSANKGRPGGTGGTPATRQVSTPIGQTKADDIYRDSPYHFGMTKIADNVVKMGLVRNGVEAALLKHHKLKSLSEMQQIVATQMAQSVIFNEDESDWTKAISTYVKNGPKNLSKDTIRELDDIRANFDSPESPVDSWMAGVLMRSKVDFTPSG